MARALKAAVLAVGHLHEMYGPFMLTGVDASASNDVRDPRLASGLPYMLWDARKVREEGRELHEHRFVQVHLVCPFGIRRH